MRQKVSDIINLHQYAGEFVQKPNFLFVDSVEILRTIKIIYFPPAKIKISEKLTYEIPCR